MNSVNTLNTKHFKHFKHINVKVLLQWGEKCGHKLESIHFIGFPHYYIKPILKLCPNIRSLTNIRLEKIENNDLLVPKLMSIKSLTVSCNNNLFETFVNKTQNSLKCLGICVKNIFNNKTIEIYKKLCEFRRIEFIFWWNWCQFL